MKKARSLVITTLLLLSFSFAFAGAGLVSAQAERDAALHVGWQVINETDDFSHDEENSEWVFGPQPTIWIGYAEDWVWNSTDISENGFKVNADDQILINISIPYEFLSSASQLEAIAFWGAVGDNQKTAFGMQYNVTSDLWESISYHYLAGAVIPLAGGFMELYEAHSTYLNNSAAESYDIVFAVVFTEEVVNDIFWTGMEVTDTLGRPISPSWLTRAMAGEYGTPPIGLGVEVPPSEFEFPRYYYAEIVGEMGDIIHYVEVNDIFTFRLVSNEPFGDVMVPFSILTYDTAYEYDYNWTMKLDPYNLFSDEVPIEGMPLMLFFVHNSTGAYALPGYLDNIEWHWIPIVRVWSVTFDILLNYTIDLSRFYGVQDILVSPTHQEILWFGFFTDYTDMNGNPYQQGATIKPDPYFWTVLDTNGRPLNARQEISRKNTVQLAFKSEFIEAFLTNDIGDLAERAMPNDILNITFQVHAPEGFVNGTYCIQMDETNIATGMGAIDLDSIQINRTLQNITISIGGYGSGSNETYSWSYTVRHYITIDLVGPNSGEYSCFMIEYENLETGVTTPAEINDRVLDLVEYLGYDINIGQDLTTLRVDFNLTANTRAAIYNDVTVEVGVWEDRWINISEAGMDDWKLMYMDNQTLKDTIEDNILWSPHRLIFGDIPIWEEPLWTVTDNGALDLDGNEFTTDDQYFVKRTATWHDEGNSTIEGMVVGVRFDPSVGVPGDEFDSSSWMGVVETLMDYEAGEQFYWCRANDSVLISSAEMDEIRDTMWADEENDIPAPGYEWIAWISINRTNIHTNIAGLESGEWSNTWFAWGTEQHYKVSASAQQQEWAAFKAKYAGLLLFNDGEGEYNNSAPDFRISDGQVVTDEVTHFVLIDSVSSLELKRPLTSTEDTGMVTVEPETPVEFGITIIDVNVTIYPLRIRDSDGIRGAWDYRQSYEAVSSLNAEDFDYWISTASVESMSFDIRFNVDMVEYDAEDPTTWNHAIAFKVDQVFGQWTLNEFGNSVLANRSLAVNFFGVLGAATRAQYTAEGAPVGDTNSDSIGANYYEFGAADQPYANVTMGGLPYYYGGDEFAQEYISGSSTAPIGAFSVMYQSASGTTVTDWQVDASMLFMTAGYEYWEGEEIRCDPVFVSYSSAFQRQSTNSTTTTTTTSTTSTIADEGQFALHLLIGTTVGIMVLILVLARRRD